jgi:hypothetical protein
MLFFSLLSFAEGFLDPAWRHRVLEKRILTAEARSTQRKNLNSAAQRLCGEFFSAHFAFPIALSLPKGAANRSPSSVRGEIQNLTAAF